MKSLIIDNRYVAQSEIKQGAFGIVYQGFDTQTKAKIAIKQEKGKKSHSASSLTIESKILAKLKDVRGVPKLFFFGRTGEFRTLILEFLGKDLQYYLTKNKMLSLKTVIKIALNLIPILRSIHDQGILHRDIKPDNILTSSLPPTSQSQNSFSPPTVSSLPPPSSPSPTSLHPSPPSSQTPPPPSFHHPPSRPLSPSPSPSSTQLPSFPTPPSSNFPSFSPPSSSSSPPPPLYICDFGISKSFMEKGKHIEMKNSKPFIGTVRFASEAAHLGLETSRKDDLESLFYVIVYLLKGKLPWQDLDKKLGALRKERVGSMKKIESLRSLFYDLPNEILEFMEYVKKLEFKEKPDYAKLEVLLKSLASQNSIQLYDDEWDWTKGKREGGGKKEEEGGKKEGGGKEEGVRKKEEGKKTGKREGGVGGGKKRKEKGGGRRKGVEEGGRESIPEIREFLEEEKKEAYVKSNSKSKKVSSFLMVGRETWEEDGVSSLSDHVYFNSKSLISSNNNDTKESSVMIMNKEFTTLKTHIKGQVEENELEEYLNEQTMRLKILTLGLGPAKVQQFHYLKFM